MSVRLSEYSSIAAVIQDEISGKIGNFYLDHFWQISVVVSAQNDHMRLKNPQGDIFYFDIEIGSGHFNRHNSEGRWEL